MNFNNTLLGFNPHPLWQLAENYLHITQKTYEPVFIIDKTVVLNSKISKPHLILTILKVISYAAVILPIVALIVRTYYRRKYKFIRVETSKNEAIFTTFKKSFEAWKVDPKVQNPLKKTYDSCENKYPLNVEEARIQLKQYFKDVPTYIHSQEPLLQLVYASLQNLIKNPQDHASIEMAKLTYKEASAFLRKYTNIGYKNQKIIYKNYLRTGEDIPPSAYLFQQHEKDFHKRNYHSNAENHTAFIFLLRHLRKQIKLATKQDKIRSIIKSFNLPNDRTEKALKYLSLNWLHGTKAFTVKSACETSNRKILPTGELKKRNVQILTGEMERGASILGINQYALSGVGLAHAKMSINYSQKFSLNIDQELKLYHSFICDKFESSIAIKDKGFFTRQMAAIGRIKKMNRDLFEGDREKLETKIQEIYKKIESEIFNIKPKHVFYFDDGYWLSNLYVFLKEMENLESLLKNPAKEDRLDIKDQELATLPVVMASFNKYGIPVCLGVYNNPSEEIYEGALKLGSDIQTLFVEDQHISTVQNLLKDYHLEDSIVIESQSVLKDAAQLENELRNYFYDVYSIRKWETA